MSADGTVFSRVTVAQRCDVYCRYLVLCCVVPDMEGSGDNEWG